MTLTDSAEVRSQLRGSKICFYLIWHFFGPLLTTMALKKLFTFWLVCFWKFCQKFEKYSLHKGEYLKGNGFYRKWIETDKCYKVTPNGFVSFTRMNSKRHGAARLQNFISYYCLVVLFKVSIHILFQGLVTFMTSLLIHKEKRQILKIWNQEYDFYLTSALASNHLMKKT